MRPVPLSISLLLLTIFFSSALMLSRALKTALPDHRRPILLASFAIGLLLAVGFSWRTYDYDPQWRIVGFPMVAAALKRVVYDNGQVAWHDYIAWPPPLIIAANFLFWLLAPSLPLSVFLWLYARRKPQG